MISHMAINAKASAGTVKTTVHVITLPAHVVVAKLGFICNSVQQVHITADKTFQSENVSLMACKLLYQLEYKIR